MALARLSLSFCNGSDMESGCLVETLLFGFRLLLKTSARNIIIPYDILQSWHAHETLGHSESGVVEERECCPYPEYRDTSSIPCHRVWPRPTVLVFTIGWSRQQERLWRVRAR